MNPSRDKKRERERQREAMATFWLSALISRSHCFVCCREADAIYCGYSSKNVVVSSPFSLVQRNSNRKTDSLWKMILAERERGCAPAIEWKENARETHFSEKKITQKHKLQRFEVSTPISILNAHNLTSARFLQSMSARNEMNAAFDTIRNYQSYFHIFIFLLLFLQKNENVRAMLMCVTGNLKLKRKRRVCVCVGFAWHSCATAVCKYSNFYAVSVSLCLFCTHTIGRLQTRRGYEKTIKKNCLVPKLYSIISVSMCVVNLVVDLAFYSFAHSLFRLRLGICVCVPSKRRLSCYSCIFLSS